MTQRPDLAQAPIGARYGSFTILGYAGQNQHKQALWLCRCDCGREKARIAWTLVNGKVSTCIHCSTREAGAKRRVNADRDAVIIDARKVRIPYSVIAEDLGISPSSIAGVVHRAKRKGLLPDRRSA